MMNNISYNNNNTIKLKLQIHFNTAIGLKRKLKSGLKDGAIGGVVEGFISIASQERQSAWIRSTLRPWRIGSISRPRNQILSPLLSSEDNTRNWWSPLSRLTVFSVPQPSEPTSTSISYSYLIINEQILNDLGIKFIYNIIFLKSQILKWL